MTGFLEKVHSIGQMIAREGFAGNALLPAGTDVTYNWYKSGRISSLGNSPGSSPWLIPWGQIFRANGATISSDVLIKVRNIRLYVLTTSTGQWDKRMDIVRPIGSMYPETFIGSTIPAVLYSVNPNPVITELVPGRCYHFFSTGDASGQWEVEDTADVGGIIVVFEAKLISKTGADISGEVGTIIGGCGADWRTTPEALPTGDAFVGSFKSLTTSFRKFYGTSSPLTTMVAHPPPAALAQLTQIDSQALDPEYVP